MSYFAEPHTYSKNKIEVKLGSSNYAAKSDLKMQQVLIHQLIQQFVKKIDLANLKSNINEVDINKYKNVPGGLTSLQSKVDKLDIGKLKTFPIDLGKVSDVVKNDAVKMTEYDKLLQLVNNIKATDTSGLVKKAYYDTKLVNLKRKVLIMILVNILILKNNK